MTLSVLWSLPSDPLPITTNDSEALATCRLFSRLASWACLQPAIRNPQSTIQNPQSAFHSMPHALCLGPYALSLVPFLWASNVLRVIPIEIVVFCIDLDWLASILCSRLDFRLCYGCVHVGFICGETSHYVEIQHHEAANFNYDRKLRRVRNVQSEAK